MVTIRCKMIVRSALQELGISFSNIELGEAHLTKGLSDSQKEHLKYNLSQFGLELMDDKRSVLIEKIKTVIIEMIHYSDELPPTNNSEYISNKVQYDYNYLSNLFSEVQGITIEQFIILHKIEKVKELLIYDELNLTEIAAKLHYSSIGHLSNQFKKITGLTPSHFKKFKDIRRITLENVAGKK